MRPIKFFLFFSLATLVAQNGAYGEIFKCPDGKYTNKPGPKSGCLPVSGGQTCNSNGERIFTPKRNGFSPTQGDCNNDADPLPKDPSVVVNSEGSATSPKGDIRNDDSKPIAKD